MDNFDYNGLDKSIDKYISLSFTVDHNWKIPRGKIAYILESSTLNHGIKSDDVLTKLRIPDLIDYVSSHIPGRTVSVLDSIKSASSLTQRYLDATSKAYEFGIKGNVIERVYYFYPWVRSFQSDAALEVTFFTLVEYRNNRRVFKIIKLIPEELPDEISLLQYLESFWEYPEPTIHIESEIYHYGPPDEEPYNPNALIICHASVFNLFVTQNFNLKLNVSNAQIALAGIGKLLATDDKKLRKTQRKLLENVCYVSVLPTLFFNYFSYAYKAFMHLSYMETYRDIFLAYKRLCTRKHFNDRQLQAKQAYERFLTIFAQNQGIRLDMSLEEFVTQKKKRKILDLALTFFAKLLNEGFSPQ